MKFLTKIILLITLAILLLFAVEWFKNNPDKNNLELPINKINQNSANTTPTDLTITQQRLTIPYLSSLELDSHLSELEFLSNNSNYSSYLASYESDDLKINGLLTIPQGETPDGGWPAVVFIHGYIPPQNYRTQERYVSYVDYLARNGLVVFKIDLRGHADSEGNPSSAYFSGDYIIDTLNAYSALQNSDFVNADKIGLWGHSMSGNIVLRSMVAQPQISAGVIWAGAVYTYDDLQEYGISDSSYQRPAADSERAQERERLFEDLGGFDTQNEFWQQVAPTNYLDKITGSIQLHHAQNDPVVSINYSRDLTQLLEAAQVDHQLYEYAQGGHDIEGSAFNQAMQRTVEFYQQNLQ